MTRRPNIPRQFQRTANHRVGPQLGERWLNGQLIGLLVEGQFYPVRLASDLERSGRHLLALTHPQLARRLARLERKATEKPVTVVVQDPRLKGQP